jgi:hypothetical protein
VLSFDHMLVHRAEELRHGGNTHRIGQAMQIYILWHNILSAGMWRPKYPEGKWSYDDIAGKINSSEMELRTIVRDAAVRKVLA